MTSHQDKFRHVLNLDLSSKSGYVCDERECKYYNTVKCYKYQWGKERPVCKSCGNAPALLTTQEFKQFKEGSTYSLK